MKIEVGKEYVVGINGNMTGFTPVNCNGQHSPKHPCRVTVVKVGRTKAQAWMSGDKTKPTKIDFEALWDVTEAKKLYRAALEKREAMWAAKGEKGLGQAFVDECVDKL